MNKTSTKTLITLLIVLISFIFIVEFTSPIQSINIGHLQKRQDPAPPPNNPPPKENPPPPPKENPPPPPKENPPPPPKENPPPPPPPPPPPKENPTPAPQPTPDTPTTNPSPPPPSPNAPAPTTSALAPDPNAPQTSSNATVPNPNSPNPDPNVPTTNPTTGPSSSPNTGVVSTSSTVPTSTTTSYLPGHEPCTISDDPRCKPKKTDPTVVSTTEENEIITQPSTTPAAPTKSQSQLAPNPKKSTITQFTTYTTTSTLFFPGYSTVTSSKGTDGELTTYATYIPPSTVVVVKKVTSAKIEEIQETNPSSAGHLDLELSVYNLYSIATSLFVIAVTMLYLIIA